MCLYRKHQQHETARKTYKDIASKNIDWPEAIWEAWLAFEHLHGSVQEIDECLDRIERARSQVNARRAKEAEKAAYAAMQVEAEQQASTLISETIAATGAGEVPEVPQHASAPMDVDARAESPSANLKRKAEDEAEVDVSESKKARTGKFC